jgi:hypothetical protein
VDALIIGQVRLGDNVLRGVVNPFGQDAVACHELLSFDGSSSMVKHDYMINSTIV